MREVGGAPLQLAADPANVGAVELGLDPAQHLPVAVPETALLCLLALVQEVTGLGQTVGVGETQREVEPRLGALLLLSVEVSQVKQTRGVSCGAENSKYCFVSLKLKPGSGA